MYPIFFAIRPERVQIEFNVELLKQCGLKAQIAHSPGQSEAAPWVKRAYKQCAL